jgi:hypothetical protein
VDFHPTPALARLTSYSTVQCTVVQCSAVQCSARCAHADQQPKEYGGIWSAEQCTRLHRLQIAPKFPHTTAHTTAQGEAMPHRRTAQNTWIFVLSFLPTREIHLSAARRRRVISGINLQRRARQRQTCSHGHTPSRVHSAMLCQALLSVCRHTGVPRRAGREGGSPKEALPH